MRTITITKELYKLDELPADIQEKVILHWRENDHFFWGDEWEQSLNGFCKIAPISKVDWQVGVWGYTFASCKVDDENIGELSGIRAWKWLANNGFFDEKLIGGNCPFTGYCGDEDLLDPIRKAKANPASIGSLEELFNDCLHSWAKAYRADLEYWYSDEAIREDIAINDYEFDREGNLA